MRRTAYRSPVILLLVILAFGSPEAVRAGRQPPARIITLEEALQLAEARSEEMVIARADVERASGDQVRARSEWFPQLTGSASYDRAFASEFSGLFDSPEPGEGLENLSDLPFGQKNAYRLNFHFSQSLYTGGRIGAQSRGAEAARHAADIRLASTRALLLLDVVRACYDGALSERMVEIAEAAYRQADATYEQARVAHEAGSLPEFELLRAKVTRDNQRPTIIRRRAERDLAVLRVKQLLEIPAHEQISLSIPLDGDTLAAPAQFAEGVALEIASDPADMIRAPIREAEASVRQRAAGVGVARAQRLPNVSVRSSYEEVAYPSGGLPSDFRRNWTLGAIVQLPILTGGRLRAEEAIARADVRAAEARLQQARELALLDTRSSYAELRAADASWEATAGLVHQAQRAYQIAELRYREGVSTQLELSDARLLLVEAQAIRAQAARDLQVARARVALLPDLPLNTPGPSALAPPPTVAPPR